MILSFIDKFKGKIFESVTLQETSEEGDQIIFRVSENEEYCMCHLQDCCESVYVEEVIGNLDWLIGNPILIAEERTNEESQSLGYQDCSKTWTFYEFSTIKGSVTIRWFGMSNGYYSEAVNIYEKQK